MLSKFHHRSERLEHIDIGDYTEHEYEGCIKELQLVNEWMGDARALRLSLLRAIKNAGTRSFSILDVGAGSGELLRVAADWCRETNRTMHAIGLELNPRSASAINDESAAYENIKAVRGDALSLPFHDRAFDYVISSLFTHHFTNEDIVSILREMKRVAARGIYIIDLHRHPIAYFLYTTVGKLVLHNRLLREDGALSILRSFNPKELFELAAEAGLEDISVARHFPFRLVLSASVNRLGNFSTPAAMSRHQAA
ncbi:MAG: SAM-dependent methyltransferase [Blastocatellia bacterium]|nr:MAG: SAM-dependent methyltransferase [Blastocatellia bacterium]